MRCAIVLAAAILVTLAHGADDATKATAILDGKKMQFPEEGLAEGVKATITLLESCHSKGDGTAADLKKAGEGDHVRLVFAKPTAVTVLDEKLEVSELVFTQPLNTGVFWLRCGDKVVRCSKYEPRWEKDFIAWRNQATVAE
jgi:hypothetical protein